MSSVSLSLYVSHSLCSICAPFSLLRYTLLLRININETWYNNLHQCIVWYVPILLHMFSYAKTSYSAVLKVSEANVSLTSAAISFCFQIPFNILNLLNCKLCLDCGTWVLHVCVIVDIWNPRSSCWKKLECFQLGGLKKMKKNPSTAKNYTTRTKNTLS